MKKSNCSIEGCTGSGPITKGLCSKHYTRLLRHGDPLKTTRFRNKFSLKDFVKNTPAEKLLNHEFRNRSQWSLACKIYYGDKCSECGWNKTTCDVNHIIPKMDGGKHTISNGEVLCPNHHAMKHRLSPIETRKYLTRNPS